MEKIINCLLYSGVDASSLKRVMPSIHKANRIMVTTLSVIASLLIGAMLLLSFRADGVRQNRIVYGFGTTMSVLVFLFSQVARRADWLVTPLVYCVYSIFYLYGIFIGAVTDPGGKTVTFMVMLVFMPTLFISKPTRVILTTVVHDALFIFLCAQNKQEPILSIDIIDAVFFGLLGVSSGIVIGNMKIRGYVSEQKLQEVSRIDQLTQMNNRNAFEFDLFSISGKCRRSLTCLYIDVNGLHELNNAKGHEYGDEMLKTVAGQVKNSFSEEFTYRIGGDEFVAFIPDAENEDVRQKVAVLSEQVERSGYHIATGYDSMPLRQLSVRELIKSAEVEMYKNKSRYYEGINRSARSETND